MKKIKGSLAVCLIFLFLALTGTAAPRDDLRRLVDSAMEWNPRVRAAQYQVERAVAEREEIRGFFDPQLSASGEYNDSVTGSRLSLLQAGVTVPLLPGVYFDTAFEERFYEEFGDLGSANLDYDRLIQSKAWLGLRVPLLQDRGWRQWRLKDLRLRHVQTAADCQLMAVCQDVRNEVEQQYFTLLEALATINVSEAAAQRAEKLWHEAEAMVELQTLPEYQLYAARSAAALRKEELLAARQSGKNAALYLMETVAATNIFPPVSARLEELVEWAELLRLPESYVPEQILAERGNHARVRASIEAEKASRELARDTLRSQLDLVAEATFQGEDPDNPIATGRYLSSRNAGFSAGLVWSRPLGYRAEKAQVRAQTAGLAEQTEVLRQTELSIMTELELAHQRFQTARARLKEATDSVDAARQALDSEDERFRLGEGRSRNVLDAQKDLTDALKRQIVAGMELLRSYHEFNFATGYSLESSGAL